MQIISKEGISLPHSTVLHHEINVSGPIDGIYKLKSGSFQVSISQKKLDAILELVKPVPQIPAKKEIKFSEFQEKVKEQLGKGLDTKAIAEELGRPENTVITSIEAINKKIEAASEERKAELEDLSEDDLKDYLDSLNVEYLADAKKPELINFILEKESEENA